MINDFAAYNADERTLPMLMAFTGIIIALVLLKIIYELLWDVWSRIPTIERELAPTWIHDIIRLMYARRMRDEH